MGKPYTLGPDEGVILEAEGVSSESSMLASDDLVLTHRRIIWVGRSLWGKVKFTRDIPLNQVKVVDGVAQVRRSKEEHDQIEISLRDGRGLSFGFDTPAEAKNWVKAVSEQVVGHPLEPEDAGPKPIPELQQAVKTAKNAVGSVAASFGIPTGGKGGNREVKVVSVRCIGCHAPLTGKRGERVTCPYCDTEQVL